MLRVRNPLPLPSIVVTLVILSAAVPAAGKHIDREFRESFPVAVGDRLDLRSGDGDVVVEPWEKGEIEIHVRYLGEHTTAGISSGSGDFEAEIERDGRTIRAVGREPGGGWSFGFVSSRVQEYRWTVRAPAWLPIDLDGEDGDVRITGWRGALDLRVNDGDVTLEDVAGDDLRFELEDGDLDVQRFEGSMLASLDDGEVRLEDCRGALRVTTEDGDLTARGGGGSLEIHTDDGDLRLVDVAVERLGVRTVDGDLTATLTTPAPTVEVRTSDGDVELGLPAAASVRLDLRTRDGSIDVDVPGADLSRADRRRTTGTVGAGEGEVTVETEDGGIDVTARR